MLRQSVKTAVVVMTSAIAVPYAFVILAHMMYGWPHGRNKYKKALHPKKVYALSYVALQELAKVRYGLLYLQWNYFYYFADERRLIKDLPYGDNGNFLDIYLPKEENGQELAGSDSKPVVMFVYGGTWSSGDKSNYGLLCTQLADKLKAVVCCPNYSIYPKGYVDDMVQDIVDCLSWIQNHIGDFGGDKDKVIMLGHSAGAHLCIMSVLELTLKRLLHSPESVLLSVSGPPAASHQSSHHYESISFEDKHFNDNNTSNASSNSDTDPNQASAATTGSFYVVDEKENEKSFFVLNENDTAELQQKSEEKRVESDSHTKEEDRSSKADVEREEVLEVKLTEQEDGSRKPEISIQEDERQELTESQKDAMDLLSSVRLVIGLAGVYHIAEHYEHEAKRGIEFISNMARAMYGPEHFARLSPTLLVAELPEKIKLPSVLLVHGDKDKTVPLASSLQLGQALWNKGCRNVTVSVLPGCSHTDICIDLMDSKRHWYDSVMNELLRGVEKCL